MSYLAQTEQHEEMILGSHRLLTEYFQYCDRKQRYEKAKGELLCSNLLFRFSGLARDKYHCNPPNIMVIRQICWWSAKYLLNISPNIRPRQLIAYFVCRKAVYCSRLQLFHFNTLIPSLFAKIHSPSLSKPALRLKILSLFQTYLDNNFCLASISGSFWV